MDLTYFRQWEWDSLRSCNFTRTISWSGYWGENEYSFNPAKTIELPLIDKIDNPAFRYRQTQCYAIRTDSIYKWWNRLEEPNEVFAAGYWVHTFDKLLPASVYGKDHPEYYSYFKANAIPESKPMVSE